MNKTILLLIISASHFVCFLNGKNEYNNIVMRDFLTFIDSYETLKDYYPITHSQGYANIAISSFALENLLYEIAPMIISSSLLKFILEKAELVAGLTDPSSQIKLQTINKFSTTLQPSIDLDAQFVQKISTMLNEIKARLNNSTINLKSMVSQKQPLPEIEKIIDEELRLSKALHFSLWPKDHNLLYMAYDLFYTFLIIEKIRNNWEVRKIDNFLYLFIPKKYLADAKSDLINLININKLNIDTEEMSKGTAIASHGITFDEAIVGLRYKRPEFAPIQDPFNSNLYQDLTSSSLDEHLKNSFIQTLEKLFITKKNQIFKDIFNIKDKDQQEFLEYYLWNICSFGHGGPMSNDNPITVGMPNQIWKNLLEFFNSKIKTNLVYEHGCYGGAPEKRRYLNIPNQNFILLVSSVSNAYTYRIKSTSLKVIQSNNMELTIEPIIENSLPRFIINLRDSKGFYFDVLNDIQRFWKLNLSHDYEFYKNNIPHIKLPNTEWISLINLNKQEFILNKTLIKLHEHNKEPIIIKNKKLVFLYPQYKYLTHPSISMDIYSPIIIQGLMPAFISMSEASTMYNFKFIEAESASLSDIVKNFMGLTSQLDSRHFYVETLKIKYLDIDALGYLNKPHETSIILNNFNIIANSKNVTLTFNINKKKYTIRDSFENFENLTKSSFKNALISSSPATVRGIMKSESYPEFETIENFLETHSIKQKMLKQKHIEEQINTLKELYQTLSNLSFATK